MAINPDLMQTDGEGGNNKPKAPNTAPDNTPQSPNMTDSRDALARLTGGQTLSDADKIALGLSPANDGTNGDGTDGTDGTDGDGTDGDNTDGTDGDGNNDGDIKPKLISTYEDPETGDIIDVYDDETEKVRKKGTKSIDAATAAKDKAAEKKAQGQSAYDNLLSEFKQYGLESLVTPLEEFIVDGLSPAEFTMKLRKTDAYDKRFGANKERVAAGLRALDEADYIAMEDQYQNIMRNYGLPNSYWAKDALGTQAGFTKLIAGDVSATELESRIQQAADVIDNSPTEYMDAIKQFYPEISRGDLMAYALDPKNGLSQIQTKIGAAKIGGEYLRAGLGKESIDMASAQELQRQGVTAEKARAGAQAIKETAPRGGQLAALYGQGPYGMQEVEAEVYGLGNATEAKRKREKISEMEQAQFSRRSGNISTALSRNSDY